MAQFKAKKKPKRHVFVWFVLRILTGQIAKKPDCPVKKLNTWQP